MNSEEEGTEIPANEKLTLEEELTPSMRDDFAAYRWEVTNEWDHGRSEEYGNTGVSEIIRYVSGVSDFNGPKMAEDDDEEAEYPYRYFYESGGWERHAIPGTEDDEDGGPYFYFYNAAQGCYLKAEKPVKIGAARDCFDDYDGGERDGDEGQQEPEPELTDRVDVDRKPRKKITFASRYLTGFRQFRFDQREELLKAAGLELASERWRPWREKPLENFADLTDALFNKGTQAYERRTFSTVWLLRDLEVEQAADKARLLADEAQLKKPAAWWRLRYALAGLSYFLPSSKNVLMAVVLAAAIMLMLASLVTLPVASGLSLSPWLLAASSLWLAPLGAPTCVALAVLGAWVAACVITYWKLPEFLADLFIMDSEDVSEVYYTDCDQTSEGESLNYFEWICSWVLQPIIYMRKKVLYGLNFAAIHWLKRKKGESSFFFMLIKGLIHMAFVAVSIPVVAVAAVLDGLFLAGRFVALAIQCAWRSPWQLETKVKIGQDTTEEIIWTKYTNVTTGARWVGPGDPPTFRDVKIEVRNGRRVRFEDVDPIDNAKVEYFDEGDEIEYKEDANESEAVAASDQSDDGDEEDVGEPEVESKRSDDKAGYVAVIIKNLVMALIITAAVLLMLTSLAALPISGLVLAHWVWVASMWLAPLGVPACIALAAVGAWVATALIVEWVQPGIISDVFLLEGAEESAIYNSTTEERDPESGYNPVAYLLWFIFFLHYGLLTALNFVAAFLSAPTIDFQELSSRWAGDGLSGEGSSFPFRVFKGLIHIVFGIVELPIFALVLILEAAFDAMRFIWEKLVTPTTVTDDPKKTEEIALSELPDPIAEPNALSSTTLLPATHTASDVEAGENNGSTSSATPAPNSHSAELAT